MNRSDFIRFGTLASLSPWLLKVAAQTHQEKKLDTELLKKLVDANDTQTGLLIESVKPGNLKFGRMIAYDISVLSASYSCPDSKYFHDERIISKLEILIAFLEKSQTSDGTMNIGNLESPPDTAFLIEILCPANHILRKDNSLSSQKINEQLKKIILKAGEGLVSGGIHTPNHRWVVSSALAQVNSLYPNKKYIDRIDDWLDEGVFNDMDGHYPERSGIYSSVENAAFINIARLTNKPELLKNVRKNLNMYIYYIEPNGDLVTNDSRRQDQYSFATKNATTFYLQYRYMAIHDNNPLFAEVVKKIEGLKNFKNDILSKSFFYFMEDETIQKKLPTPVALPDKYEKLFETSHLLRIKENNITATLFGGIDWPLIIASGRSCSPDFFSFRKGDAILKYMRLSTTFFSMGYFYSEGLKKEGNKYILHKKTDIPYYQPLPKDKRNKKGDYQLSPSIDDRFWNKMDFKNRPVSNVKTLETSIVLTHQNGKVELEFNINGLNEVPITIEMCFASGGILTGVTNAENDNKFLEKGMASYLSGKDTIEFGPGNSSHQIISALEGERYSTHFGTLRTEGMHVYITGKTPFKHTLKFS